MTSPAVVLAQPRLRVLVLCCGLLVAVALRVTVAGPAGPESRTAGLIFAGALTAMAVVAGVRLRWRMSALLVGLIGGVALAVPVLLTRTVGAHRPAGSFALWAVVAGVVATAEELFLRGALFGAVTRRHGEVLAVVVGAVAFALLHLPLYGVGSLPIDLAAGLTFGALRVATGSLLAPIGAHVTADWLGWWLV
jgi:membrane protease YdiL (CAAX protease family)